MLEENAEFTVSVPMGEFDKKILGVCGTRSGRDEDKFAICGFTAEEAKETTVPGIRELPLTLECRVVYKQDQDPKAISAANTEKFYPSDVDGNYHGANRDYHTAYYGEIVAAYIIE